MIYDYKMVKITISDFCALTTRLQDHVLKCESCARHPRPQRDVKHETCTCFGSQHWFETTAARREMQSRIKQMLKEFEKLEKRRERREKRREKRRERLMRWTLKVRSHKLVFPPAPHLNCPLIPGTRYMEFIPEDRAHPTPAPLFVNSMSEAPSVNYEGASVSYTNIYGDGNKVTSDLTTSPTTNVTPPTNSPLSASSDSHATTKSAAAPRPHWKAKPGKGLTVDEAAFSLTSSGNVIDMTQAGAGSSEVFDNTPSWAPGYVTDEPEVPQNAVLRMFKGDDFTMLPTDHQWKVLLQKDLCSLLGKDPNNLFQNNLAQHRVLRADMEVKIVLNANQFMGGAVCLFAFPEAAPLDTDGNLVYGPSCFLAPKRILNLRSATEVKLTLPYVGVNPHAPVGRSTLWNIVVCVYGPLTSPAGNPQSLSGHVYVTPKKVEFNALSYMLPTPLGMNAQGYVDKNHVPAPPAAMPPLEGEEEEEDVNRHVGTNVRTVSVSGSFIASNVMGGQSVPLACGDQGSPNCDYMPGEVKSLLELVEEPTFVQSVDWTVAQPAGTLLWSCSLSPDNAALKGTSFSLLRLFAMWRGSVTASFMFTGSRQHFGRLGVCFNPGDDTPPTDVAQAELGHWTVYDVGTESVVDVNAPYMMSEPWLPTSGTSGVLSLWIIDPLVNASTSAQSVEIQVTLGAGTDLSVHRLAPIPERENGEGDEVASTDVGDAPLTPPTADASGEPIPQVTGVADLQSYFGLFRPFTNRSLTANQWEVIGLWPHGSVPEFYTPPAQSSILEFLLRMFAYYRADLSVQIRARSTSGGGGALQVRYYPPTETPTTTPPPGEGVTDTLLELNWYSTVSATFDIPYSSSTAVLATTERHWDTVNRADATPSRTPGSGFGSIALNASTATDVQMFIGLRNARFWIPICMPGSFAGNVVRDLGVQIPPDFDAPNQEKKSSEDLDAERHAPIPTEYSEEELEELKCLINEHRVFVGKTVRRGYKHWSIQCGPKAISLSQEGFRAIVALETPGEEYEEVNPECWLTAVMCLGKEFPGYGADNNCTHFVSNLTGVSIENTGTWLMTALIGAGFAALATGVVMTERHMFSAARTIGGLTSQDMREAIYEVPRHITETAQTLQASVTDVKDTVTNLKPSIDTAAASIATAASSVTSFAQVVPSLLSTVTELSAQIGQVNATASRALDAVDAVTTTVKDGAKEGIVKVCSFVLKLVSCCVIIMSAPCPGTVFGVLGILAAECMERGLPKWDGISKVLSRFFKIKITRQDVRVLFDGENEVVDILDAENPDDPERHVGVVQEFNHGVTALRNTEWLVDRGFKLVERIVELVTGRVREDPYAQLLALQPQMDELRVKINEAHQMNPIPSSDDVKAWRILAIRWRDIANKIERANPFTHQTALLVSGVESLKISLARAAAETRPQPVVVYLWGDSGTGKSTATGLLSTGYCKILGVDPKTSVYTKPPGTDFFDGYVGQPVMIMDDLGQDPEGKDWQNFAAMVSPTPFRLPMANLTDKGIVFRSELIIITSNSETVTPNAMRCASAVTRRLTFKGKIEPQTGYSTPNPSGKGSAMLDPSKLAGATCTCPKPTAFKKCHPLLCGGAIRYRPAQDQFKTSKPTTPLTILQLLAQIVIVVAKHKSVSDVMDDLCYQIGEESPCGCNAACNCGDFAVPPPPYFSEEVICEFCKCVVCMCDTEDKARVEGKCTSCFGPIQDHSDEECLAVRRTHGRINRSDPLRELLEARRALVERVNARLAERVEPHPSFLIRAFEKVLDNSWWWVPALTLLGSLASAISIYFLWKKGTAPETQGPYSGLAKKIFKRPAPERQGNGKWLDKVTKACYPVAAGSSRLTAFNVFDRYYIISTHLWDGYRDHQRVESVTLRSCEINRDMIVGTYGDLTLVRHPTAAPGKDLRKYLVQPDFDPTPWSGMLVVANGTNSTLIQTRAHAHQTTVSFGDGSSEDEVLRYKAVTFPGACGAPLIVCAPSGWKIAGIHCAGILGQVGFAKTLTQSTMEKLLQVEREGIRTVVGIAEPSAHVSRKSCLKPSPAMGAFPLTKEPAALTKNDPRLNDGVNLDEVMFGKFVGDVDTPWPNLVAAADLYLTRATWEWNPSPLSTAEAINGVPGLEPLDMSQSSGYPWCTRGVPRRKLFQGRPGEYMPTPELAHAIEETTKNPKYLPFVTFLKDELRPVEKVKAGKTRLVDASPLPHAILMRQHWGSLYAHFHEHCGTRTGSAVGCNPDTDWTKFAWAFAHASRVYDLDYSCFDGTIPSVMYEVMADWFAEHGASELAVTLLRDLKSTRRVYGKEEALVTGTMASGVSGTSIFNSIINNITIISALMSDPTFDPDQVVILAYGDDVLYCHEPSIPPTIIKTFYDKYTPFSVTPASKSGDFNTESTLSDVTFLKRRFVEDTKRPGWFHPVIDPDTYQQSVMWVRTGDFHDVITSLSYLAWHAGPEPYQAWCNQVQSAIVENGLDPFPMIPYTYLRCRWEMCLEAE